MKKVLILTLVCLLVFGFTLSCRKKVEEAPPPPPPQVKEQPKVEKVVEPAPPKEPELTEEQIFMRKSLEEINREADQAGDLMSLAESSLRKGPRMVMTETLGQVSLALHAGSLRAAFEAEDRAAVTLRMTEVALALAAYRSDHGSYPEKLDQLVPNYLDEVPQDVFTEGELRYKPSGEDYVLYSVGPNGQDEEGRIGDSEPPGDDVVIRTPSPER